VEVAAAADGTLLALRARVVSDAGAYHGTRHWRLEPLGTASILRAPTGRPPYEIRGVALATTSRRSAPIAVGMTMGAFVIERLLDLVRRAPLSTRPRCGGAISSRARRIRSRRRPG